MAPSAFEKKALSFRDESKTGHASSLAKRRGTTSESMNEDNHNKAKRLKVHDEPRKAISSEEPTTEILNKPPNIPLDIFVFGEGAGGELGLGSKVVSGRSPIEVTAPRINELLSAKDVGVVQISCGGMHGIAITKDNHILTWGVNDHGTLGRETNAEEDKDDVLNPAESTPTRVKSFAFNTDVKWAQVVGTDCASFALTSDGRVAGWGTFRGRNGIIGFRAYKRWTVIQKTPDHIPGLEEITQLAAGNNHVLALDKHGKVYAWGCGERAQISYNYNPIRPRLALKPRHVKFMTKDSGKIVKIACGSYHSFALDEHGHAYAWGLNNFGQLGNPNRVVGINAFQTTPIRVQGLRDYKIVHIAGGEHHSLAVTAEGKLLTWGRIDGFRTGHQARTFTQKNSIFDKHGKPRVLAIPTIIPRMPKITSVAAGPDHSFALTANGNAYSWGSSYNYRTGHKTEEDVEIPKLIMGVAFKRKELMSELVFAGSGGPFSILAAVAESTT